MAKAGIYIHIPFCTTKCMYCDYYSITKSENDMPEFVNMLILEIKITAQNYNHNWRLDTIFFGGGTPSLMSPKQMETILNSLAKLNLSQFHFVNLLKKIFEEKLEKFDIQSLSLALNVIQL